MKIHPRTSVLLLLVFLLLIGGFTFVLLTRGSSRPDVPLETFAYQPVNATSTDFKYLAFQIFTFSPGSHLEGNNLGFSPESLDAQVQDIVGHIGTTSSGDRSLAFIVGPLTFDQSDQNVTELIDQSFAIAEKYDIAVGFHIDDSMFWELDSALAKPENIEWIDWSGTPYQGRELDWSATPMEIAPQLCLNSPGVMQAVQSRGALIAKEIARNIADLDKKNKGYLFAGVIAGWETQIGKDFATGKVGGYCALTNAGYSRSDPPKDIDAARAAVVAQFADLWAHALAASGVPAQKIYSHIAVQPYLPVSAAFGADHNPGFSTYPDTTDLTAMYAAIAESGNQPWSSSEGAAIDPAKAGQGDSRSVGPESYLAQFFNHGATLVNIYGWGLGGASNPFNEVAEGNEAVNAYRKFLSSQVLEGN